MASGNIGGHCSGSLLPVLGLFLTLTSLGRVSALEGVEQDCVGSERSSHLWILSLFYVMWGLIAIV